MAKKVAKVVQRWRWSCLSALGLLIAKVLAHKRSRPEGNAGLFAVIVPWLDSVMAQLEDWQRLRDLKRRLELLNTRVLPFQAVITHCKKLRDMRESRNGQKAWSPEAPPRFTRSRSMPAIDEKETGGIYERDTMVIEGSLDISSNE